MTSPTSIHVRTAAFALAVVFCLSACTTIPRPVGPATGSPGSNHTPSSPTAATDSTSLSPTDGCDRATIDEVRAALAAVEGYRYSASGTVHEEVYPADPEQSPTTRQVPVSFEGAYQAPDRGALRYTGRAPEGEPAETRTIDRDLWVLTEDGWQSLPGAVTSEGTNVIADLVDDFGGTWKPSGRPEPAGDGCLLVAREPTPGTKGTRELALRVDPATGLPTVLRAEVRNAVDRLGNRQDSELEYRVTLDPEVVIEAPESASPPS